MLALALQAVLRAEQAARPPQASRPPRAADPAPAVADPGLAHRVIVFEPRRSAQQTWGVALLVCVLLTVGTGYLGYESRATAEIAVAVAFAVLSLVLWSAYATATPARLTLDHGTLDVQAKGNHHRFDLASPATTVEVRGTAGRRGWQVAIVRKSMPPFVIDATMVDPVAFTEALEACRAVAERRRAESTRRRPPAPR